MIVMILMMLVSITHSSFSLCHPTIYSFIHLPSIFIFLHSIYHRCYLIYHRCYFIVPSSIFYLSFLYNISSIFHQSIFHQSIYHLSIYHQCICLWVGKENAGASTIHQKLVFVGREDGKLLAMRQLIQSGKLDRYANYRIDRWIDWWIIDWW